MKSRVLAILFGLTAVTTAVIGAEPEFSADRIRAHVSFLADDLLEGREAGTRGHEIAANYMPASLPGGREARRAERRVLFKVDLLESTLTGPTPTLTVTTSRGTQTLKHRGNCARSRSGGRRAVNLSAPLVFVGFGMKDAAVGYDDYKGLDVRGKIVVVSLRLAEGDRQRSRRAPAERAVACGSRTRRGRDHNVMTRGDG